MLYPEQNEARLKLSLDGTWAFALGSCVEDQFDPAKPLPDAQPIAVPASYNDQNDQTTALLHPGETVLLTVACDNRVNHSTLPVGNEDGQLAFFWIGQRGHPQCGGCQARRRTPEPPQL